jgi:hypothetical protein
MLNPSRNVVIAIAVVAFVAVFLGLNTDAGFFSWVGGAVLGLYLAAVGVARLARRPARSP